MNLKTLLPLIYFAIAIFIFEVMNWYGTKYVQATWTQIARYAIMTIPLQLIGYIALVWGLNLGFKQFGDIWQFIITTSTISMVIKLSTAYAFFKTLPANGKIVGLMLLVIANLVAKLWK